MGKKMFKPEDLDGRSEDWVLKSVVEVIYEDLLDPYFDEPTDDFFEYYRSPFCKPNTLVWYVGQFLKRTGNL